MIRQPNEYVSEQKHIRILIAGFPGIGKSTLALSAPKPLHVDLDFGLDRIEPIYRTPYIQPKNYEELKADLVPENLKDFETIVLDTGGKLITLIGLWAMRIDPKYGQKDGSPSLKGWGAIKREFNRLMDYIYYELKKNIVIVFHTIEDKDGDDTKLRLKCEGGAKNDVWEPMDLGGFVEIVGKNRTIGFSNCERYFAKGTRGIHGLYQIPELTDGAPNTFLTDLFNMFNEKNAEETAKAESDKADYERAMAEGKAILDSVTDLKTLNIARDSISNMNHALTSKKELGVKFNALVKKLGAVRDAKTNTYVAKENDDAKV